jgi:hypothetical protein
MEEIPLGHYVAWGVRFRDDEIRRQDEAEIDKLFCEPLMKLYGHVKPTEPPTELVQAYTKKVKAYVHWCREVGIGEGPMKPGPVAAYLDHLRDEGAKSPELELTADAISYWVRVNHDPTTDPLVRAVLAAAAGELPSSEPISRESN